MYNAILFYLVAMVTETHVPPLLTREPPLERTVT